jgi:hypothetical protein
VNSTITATGLRILCNTAQGGSGGLIGAQGTAVGGAAQGGGVYLSDAALTLTGTEVLSNVAIAGLGFLGDTPAMAAGGGVYEAAGSTLNTIAMDYIFGNFPNDIASGP